jgi:predicted phosphohydrolase
MKISIASDLHLDTYNQIDPFNFRKMFANTSKADLLILAGDISEFRFFSYFINMFDFLVSEYDNVIIIKGNHEHYNSSSFQVLDQEIEAFFESYPTIHFLNKQKISLGGINFIGATLWTDMNNRNPLYCESIRYFMNDFKQIKDSETFSKITPEATVIEHLISKKYIVESLSSDSKNVVITHHSPSNRSWKMIHDEYDPKYDFMGAYCSNLDEMIEELPIDLWIHGHIHEGVDYMISTTRVVCNPSGYPGQNDFKLKTISI